MKKHTIKPQLLSHAQYVGQPGFCVTRRTLDTSFPLHAHEFFEMELILSGEGVQILNGTSYPLKPGSITFLTPADFHSVTPSSPLQYYNLMFTEQFCPNTDGADALLSESGVCISLSAQELATATGFFNALACESLQKPDHYTVSYQSSLLRAILILLFRSLPKSFSKTATPSSIQTVLYTMHRHFREPLTLTDAAQIAHLSPHYFSTVFKETTGIGFWDYLTRLRLRYAYRCLATREYSITEICYLCGFSAFSTFARVFKAYFGKSPSEIQSLFKQTQKFADAMNP